MLKKAARRRLSAHLFHKMSSFRSDEGGAIAIFVIFAFVIMIMFGGIAVDVMRFEMRRVALQQTMDRAVLAAANMAQKIRTPQEIATDWFTTAGLGDELTFDYSAPLVTGDSGKNKRYATITSGVRSYNHFMGWLDIPYMEAPITSSAAEGKVKVEVVLVLDITGSMDRPAVAGETKTKIEALRTAAENFVTIVKGADSKNGVSIGVVPYASQVNIPVSLRQKYNVTRLSSWDGIANQGVPDINCIEIPTSTYTSTALSRTLSMPMAAVADTFYFSDRKDYGEVNLTQTTNFLRPTDYPPSIQFGPRVCTTKADDPATAENETEYNQVLLPTKDAAAVKKRIAQLSADGNTSIAIGMRWGTAILDQSATQLYTITDSDGSIRPFQNNDASARKIIVLMTDGEHVQNNYVYDNYKTGPSPIWLGTDGAFALNFSTATRGPFTGSIPTTCSGWPITSTRTVFIPQHKANSVRARFKTSDPEGQSSGTANPVTGACDPRAWVAPQTNGTVTWPQRDANNNIMRDASNNPIMVTARRLDWSEVWRYLRMEYLISQVYQRSDVSSKVSGSSLRDTFRGTYISASNMDTLLQQNCAAARTAKFEIYGIAFAAPDGGKTQIKNCATPDDKDTKYYFDATNNADLTAAFNDIASDITDLRLTQ